MITTAIQAESVLCPACGSVLIKGYESIYRDIRFDPARECYLLRIADSEVDAPGAGGGLEFECLACLHTWCGDNVQFDDEGDEG